ncbi:MAG: hypothetical protein R3D44_18760 [Hyphomicrobiaceae bacterium]
MNSAASEVGKRGHASAADAVRALLESECAARIGEVPGKLNGALVETPAISIARDAFLLRLPDGLAFAYRRGDGVTVQRPPHVRDAEVEVYLNGSVHGAIAWINGLVPLHASAVLYEGRVHAFTGPSGAGKSTLAAALSARGLPLFADDVLVLAREQDGHLICLPGHKRLKLWSDAIAMTGLAASEQVETKHDKFFVEPPARGITVPSPIAALYFLEDADVGCELLEITGVQRFRSIPDALYRQSFLEVLTSDRDLFAVMANIAADLPMKRFRRVKRKDRFADSVGFIASAILGS